MNLFVEARAYSIVNDGVAPSTSFYGDKSPTVKKGLTNSISI